ncbi:MAG: 1-(5-phosphoribosyl)-5-[(5-phosphoribosylamino)methylideneamino]imidazole-4-carboxamide isomerase [Phycisphaerae bacterium]|jgi:phosphoribosylformimino-5-aminoimidazole carboxamide ribotide isomerase
MEVLPAIDLLGGRCVRLVQGRYDRVLQYEGDPLEVAESFRRRGATWLHVIDLDGARDGRIANLDTLRRLAQTGMKIEFGGGVRDEAAIQAALDAGATRVIVGTRALQDWAWFKTLVHMAAYMDKVVLGLDAKLGKLSIRGWQEDTQRGVIDIARAVSNWPLSTICYTDIGRDGMLLGPNIESIRAVSEATSVPIVAVGGVTDLEDVRRLSQLNLAGIVIGRAIYEETIDLVEALRVAHRSDEPK